MVDHRNLRYHRLNPRVDRGGIDDSTAGIAGPPDTDAIAVHTRRALKETHAVAEILHLDEREELTARLTFALTKAAIVNRKHYITRSRKELALANQRFLGLRRSVT